MKQSDQIKEHLLIVMKENLTIETLNALFDCGAMQVHTVLPFVIKSDYFIMKKGSDISTRSAIIDLSIKWGACETKVKNIIYKTPHLIV